MQDLAVHDSRCRQSRKNYARDWKKENRWQGGGHPVLLRTGRIDSGRRRPDRSCCRRQRQRHCPSADAHLQAYSCSLVRGALEDALAGRLDFLDGAMVFPHTCDSIQRLSDIWRMNAPGRLSPGCGPAGQARHGQCRALHGSGPWQCKNSTGVDCWKRAITDRPICPWGPMRCCGRDITASGLPWKDSTPFDGTDPSLGSFRAAIVHAVVRSSMVMDRREFPQVP